MITKKRVEIIGSWDEATKTARITLIQPCPTPELAMRGAKIYAAMYHEAMARAVSEFNQDGQSTTHTE